MCCLRLSDCAFGQIQSKTHVCTYNSTWAVFTKPELRDFGRDNMTINLQIISIWFFIEKCCFFHQIWSLVCEWTLIIKWHSSWREVDSLPLRASAYFTATSLRCRAPCDLATQSSLYTPKSLTSSSSSTWPFFILRQTVSSRMDIVSHSFIWFYILMTL